MIKYAIVALLFVQVTTSVRLGSELRKHKPQDPFVDLDRLAHTFTYHYPWIWPWEHLVRAASAMDAEEKLEEPKIVTDPNKFQVNVVVKGFKADELKVKVKNRNIVVEGKHKETTENKQFIANHFVQRFTLPPGSKESEVTATLSDSGLLTISAPKHELPPPLPEREVPIVVLLSETKNDTEKPTEEAEKVEETKDTDGLTVDDIVTEGVKPVAEDKQVKKPDEVEKKDEEVLKAAEVKNDKVVNAEVNPSSSASPLERLGLSETTTSSGKIRKKELKGAQKTAKDNEVSKGLEGNNLDYEIQE